MKIYYDIPDDLDPDILPQDFYDTILNALPETMRPGLRGIIEGYPRLNKNLVIMSYEKKKFEIMWKLRSIEKEINSQEGYMILQKDGRLLLKDYTDDLILKINGLLSLK